MCIRTEQFPPALPTIYSQVPAEKTHVKWDVVGRRRWFAREVGKGKLLDPATLFLLSHTIYYSQQTD